VNGLRRRTDAKGRDDYVRSASDDYILTVLAQRVPLRLLF
jgi:hypothetical protein